MNLRAIIYLSPSFVSVMSLKNTPYSEIWALNKINVRTGVSRVTRNTTMGNIQTGKIIFGLAFWGNVQFY